MTLVKNSLQICRDVKCTRVQDYGVEGKKKKKRKEKKRNETKKKERETERKRPEKRYERQGR